MRLVAARREWPTLLVVLVVLLVMCPACIRFDQLLWKSACVATSVTAVSLSFLVPRAACRAEEVDLGLHGEAYEYDDVMDASMHAGDDHDREHSGYDESDGGEAQVDDVDAMEDAYAVDTRSPEEIEVAFIQVQFLLRVHYLPCMSAELYGPTGLWTAHCVRSLLGPADQALSVVTLCVPACCSGCKTTVPDSPS